MKLLKGSSPEALELVEALGLDGSRIRSITLNLTAGKMASLDVEMYVTEVDASTFLRVLKNYKLVEIE